MSASYILTQGDRKLSIFAIDFHSCSPQVKFDFYTNLMNIVSGVLGNVL